MTTKLRSRFNEWEREMGKHWRTLTTQRDIWLRANNIIDHIDKECKWKYYYSDAYPIGICNYLADVRRELNEQAYICTYCHAFPHTLARYLSCRTVQFESFAIAGAVTVPHGRE